GSAKEAPGAWRTPGIGMVPLRLPGHCSHWLGPGIRGSSRLRAITAVRPPRDSRKRDQPVGRFSGRSLTRHMESHSSPSSCVPRVVPRILSTLTCLGLMTALTLPMLGDRDTDVAAADLAAPSQIISHTGSIYFSQSGHTLN